MAPTINAVKNLVPMATVREISEEALERFFKIYGKTNVNISMPINGALHATSNLPKNWSFIGDMLAGVTHNKPNAVVQLSGELTEKAINANLRVNQGQNVITNLTLDGDKNLVRYIINCIRKANSKNLTAIDALPADTFKKVVSSSNSAEMVENAFKTYKAF